MSPSQATSFLGHLWTFATQTIPYKFMRLNCLPETSSTIAPNNGGFVLQVNWIKISHSKCNLETLLGEIKMS